MVIVSYRWEKKPTNITRGHHYRSDTPAAPVPKPITVPLFTQSSTAWDWHRKLHRSQGPATGMVQPRSYDTREFPLSGWSTPDILMIFPVYPHDISITMNDHDCPVTISHPVSHMLSLVSFNSRCLKLKIPNVFFSQF